MVAPRSSVVANFKWRRAAYHFCYLRSQTIELLCESADAGLGGVQLSPANRVHDFYPSDRTASGPKKLEAEHRAREVFHRSVILLHNISKILGVAKNDGRFMRLIERVMAAVFAPL